MLHLQGKSLVRQNAHQRRQQLPGQLPDHPGAPDAEQDEARATGKPERPVQRVVNQHQRRDSAEQPADADRRHRQAHEPAQGLDLATQRVSGVVHARTLSGEDVCINPIYNLYYHVIIVPGDGAEKVPLRAFPDEGEMAKRTHEGHLNASGKRFALIVSRYNEFFSSRLLGGAEDCLLRHGAAAEDVEVFRVPGALELALVAKKVAETGKFHAVVCLGAVVRGQTPHFDLVASEAVRGVSRVGLETGVPTVFGVITTDTIEQAVDRSGARAGNRGAEAALAAVEMANLLEGFSTG